MTTQTVTVSKHHACARLRRMAAYVLMPCVAALVAVATLTGAAGTAQAAADATGSIHLAYTHRWWGVSNTNIGCPNINDAYLSLVDRKNLPYDCYKWTAVPEGRVTSSGPFSIRGFDRSLRGDKIWYFTSVGSNPTEYMAEAYGHVGTENKSQPGRLWVQDGGYLVSVLYTDAKNKLEVLSGILRDDANLRMESPGHSGARQKWSIP